MGSKRLVAAQIAQLLSGQTGRYIEPYAGSAAVYFALSPSVGLLSDCNAGLIEMYQEIRVDPQEVHARLLALSLRNDYDNVRASVPNSATERAARFIYLNAWCFNGLYRTNRDDIFNVPKGSRAGRIPTLTELLDASVALEGADIFQANASDVLVTLLPGDVTYLDPPYPVDRPTYGEYGYPPLTSIDLDETLTILHDLDSRGTSFVLSMSQRNIQRGSLGDGWMTLGYEARSRVGGADRTLLRKDVLITNIRIEPAAIQRAGFAEDPGDA